ncbi:hypothetical protein [Spirosoma gilvum]
MNLLSDEIATSENNKQAILNILAYSDIFNYPLTKQEIYDRGIIDHCELDKILLNLIAEKKLFKFEEFYSLHEDYKIIQLRKLRNRRSEEYLKTAKLIIKIIRHFPYIRGVFLSGSISKNCIDKNSDIDYFIITAANRLWIAHFCCSMFRRIALLNSSKFFCYNYLVDVNHLYIDEQSLYTAIEIKSLIPLLGYHYYETMQKENKWTNKYFPNYTNHIDIDIAKSQPLTQKIVEYFFNNKFGDWFDSWLLNYSIRKRRRKFKSLLFEQPQYYIDLQKHVAKSHITDKYPKIMKEYLLKIERNKI